MVWNILYFSIYWGRIIPTDELIFFRGVGLNHQPVLYVCVIIYVYNWCHMIIYDYIWLYIYMVIYIYIYLCVRPRIWFTYLKNIRSFPQRTQLFPPARRNQPVEVRRYSDAIGSAVSVWISMRAFVTPDLHRIPWESLELGWSLRVWHGIFHGILLDVDGFWWNCIRDQWDTSIKNRDFSIN